MDDLREDDDLEETETSEDELFMGEDDEDELGEDTEPSEDEELDAFGMHVEEDEEESF